MYPQLAGGHPLVGPNSFKTLGEGPRLVPPKREFPLLIVKTSEGWKAEYTLGSRMQIHESLTVLALLTRGEARTGDPLICSLIHTYIHIYIFIQDTPCQHSRLVFQGVLFKNLIQFPNTICLKPKISKKKKKITKRPTKNCSTNVVAPWLAAIAPKFKALGKAQELPLASLRFPPCSCTYPGRMEG